MASRGVVVEELGVADVTTDDADRAVTRLFMIERSLFPALAAAVASPGPQRVPGE